MTKNQLQPLRVSSGWLVSYNEFLDLELNQENVERYDFKEDLLQARHEQYDLLIDLGFYPEGNYEEGHLCVAIYQGDFNGRLLHETKSKSKNTIVAEMNRLFTEISGGVLNGTKLEPFTGGKSGSCAGGVPQ